MKLKIYFDNGKKGEDKWGCEGTLVAGKKQIIDYLEVLIERIKSEEKEDKKYTKKYSKRNSIQEKERKMKVELIKTNLKRYTFESPKIKKWVEDNSKGKVLNLFAGRTKLNLDEVRNDLDKEMNADYHKDALDFVLEWKGEKFDTIILDPPYSYRKSMEMYKGNRNSRFKLIADNIENVLKENGIIISFGYHSTFMGNKRDFELIKLCVFAHGGSQHSTIGIIERRKKR